MNYRLLTITIGALALSASMAAGPVMQRQQNQQARIRQGARTGELTRAETVRLQRNAAAIQNTVRRDRVDGGGLTARERMKIDKMQDAQSRAIYREKHDNDRR